jgi:hypothetical protein
MDSNYFRKLVEKSLDMAFLPYTPHMVNQILGTAAVESDFFQYGTQYGGGPALGYFQCEPATRQDIIDNYLKYQPRLLKRLENAFGNLEVRDYFFTINIPLQVVFCYLHYNRYGAWGRDIYGYASAWKRVYNTHKGKGTVEDFILKYHRYVEE